MKKTICVSCDRIDPKVDRDENHKKRLGCRAES